MLIEFRWTSERLLSVSAAAKGMSSSESTEFVTEKGSFASCGLSVSCALESDCPVSVEQPARTEAMQSAAVEMNVRLSTLLTSIALIDG